MASCYICISNKHRAARLREGAKEEHTVILKKKRKKKTVPSCDLDPIVNVNEPFNRIGSFVNVTTLIWMSSDEVMD